MEYAQIADYLLRPANPDDQAQIYHLKAQSVRPYVDKIWGWDEVFQQQDFARDFQAIERFQVIEVGGNFAGFIQASFLGQHRTIWQEHSAKDFASYESYKRAGILYVFPPFITARMGQKIGRRPQTQLCGDALDPYYEIQEFHLLPAYRGKGIGSQILRQLQETCTAQGQTIRIGCFRENQRAKALYEKLGFVETSETDTHFILEYPHDFTKKKTMIKE